MLGLDTIFQTPLGPGGGVVVVVVVVVDVVVVVVVVLVVVVVVVLFAKGLAFTGCAPIVARSPIIAPKISKIVIGKERVFK